MRNEVKEKGVSKSIAMPSTNWKAVGELKRQREKEKLRSVSVRDSIQQFVQLVQFAEKLPKWGNLKKLRQFNTEELIQWKKKIDSLGRGSIK